MSHCFSSVIARRKRKYFEAIYHDLHHRAASLTGVRCKNCKQYKYNELNKANNFPLGLLCNCETGVQGEAIIFCNKTWTKVEQWGSSHFLLRFPRNKVAISRGPLINVRYYADFNLQLLITNSAATCEIISILFTTWHLKCVAQFFWHPRRCVIYLNMFRLLYDSGLGQTLIFLLLRRQCLISAEVLFRLYGLTEKLTSPRDAMQYNFVSRNARFWLSIDKLSGLIKKPLVNRWTLCVVSDF